MKHRILNLSILGLVVTLCILANSCTIQKRVHRKGWYISWNKNYKSNTENKTKETDHGSLEDDNRSEHQTVQREKHTNPDALKATQENTKNDRVTIPSHKKAREKTRLNAPMDVDVSMDSGTSDASHDTLPQKEDEQVKNDIRTMPLGGPYIFTGLFSAIGLVALALGGIEIFIAAFAVVITALIIIINVTKTKNGKRPGKIIRTSGFYNSVLFIALLASIGSLLLIYGGLAELLGTIIFIFLLLLIALLAYLLYVIKDKEHAEVLREKQQREAEKDTPKTSEEKRKQRIAGLVIGGILIALFLTIGLVGS